MTDMERAFADLIVANSSLAEAVAVETVAREASNAAHEQRLMAENHKLDVEKRLLKLANGDAPSFLGADDEEC